MGRTVTLVLVDAAGDVLGALPPFDVALPWWQEIADVVEEARVRHGVTVTVLRLLAAGAAGPPGGPVTYLAQVGEPVRVPLRPYDAGTGQSPRRAPWAVPGGPAASLRWALGRLGRDDVVAAQQRTWNLSSIWRLDAGGVPVAWLKQVPAFFAHEAPLLRLVAQAAPGLVPAVLAAGDPGRVLLAHVPGEDRYGADAAFCAEVARDFHPVQVHFASRVCDLLAAGVPDRRLDQDRLARVAAPWRDAVEGLDELMEELPARLAAIDACGLPDTLVHGDLHPGNVRESAAGRRVILDWGDAAVANPAYDILRLTEELPEREATALIGEWAGWWRQVVPDCDPETAAALTRPVAALRAAAVYQDFLDQIEESERPYHEADVPERLTAAVAAACLT
ncbi:phosphotransferase family protein [Couchioplanes azureus]|uniref:phosphotransferase family protein n=1 Tax=Couchioplanes caeruleus TaxID=56438 RepID=UPI001670AC93|nr:aminoglycoside phosphotransferase family protein [Couchioplanes caeruleus]GGQ54346.1 hypothetical protein GCM10010166_24100 [Couchioplanes caeruleus subsp. azureus]